MRKPFVVGHRGAAGLEPENTIRSIRRAVDLGVDAVEVDVRRAGSGELVIIHDPTVDRTTNGKGKVSSLPLPELKLLDAGKGESIPTLEELLPAMGSETGLFIEIKEVETVPDVLELVKRSGMVGRTTFVSFFHASLRQVKELSPSSRCGAIFSGEPARPANLALDVGAELIVPNHVYLSRWMVEEAHRNSVLVQAWTVNGLEDLNKVVSYGVDGVASDLPNTVIGALR